MTVPNPNTLESRTEADIEGVVDLEQQFYDIGYGDGLAHGAIHGRIEGHQLGVEKGFEMWEELGFYEAFGRLWAGVAQGSPDGTRAHQHASALLNLISAFPASNPSHVQADGGGEIDIVRLFNQIRSKYKMLCTSVGAKPSLRAVDRLETRSSIGSVNPNDGGGVLSEVTEQSRKLWDAQAVQDGSNARSGHSL